MIFSSNPSLESQQLGDLTLSSTRLRISVQEASSCSCTRELSMCWSVETIFIIIMNDYKEKNHIHNKLVQGVCGI
jgi:hypothetical protein